MFRKVTKIIYANTDLCKVYKINLCNGTKSKNKF